jgi:ABC transporter, phosphonate, periplasmic substrate-binding protein
VTPYAVLGMYPLAPLRPAWSRLWAAVHALEKWTPPTLTWVDDVRPTWTDPACVVAHACGWPVATHLRDHVDVVGAFSLELPEASGHRYRSVLLASRSAPLPTFVTPSAVAAANSDDSLSGWICLRAATVGGGDWPGAVTWTGAHVASLEALQERRADLIAVDPLTLAHVRRHRPDLVAGLHVVGHGPLVPSPPIVVPRGTSHDRIAGLRDALSTAVATPAVAARADLLVTGFVGLDHDAYDRLLELTAVRYDHRGGAAATHAPHGGGAQPRREG